MKLTKEILRYIDSQRDEALNLLIELAQIPAPSNHEEERARFCLNWLHAQGAESAYIDDALNVVYPVGCCENGPLTVYMAHSDVVFPDTAPLPLKIEGGQIKCPGIGDDTANAAALLMAAKYIAQNKLQPIDGGLLLVINSGEEGLGNLKGCRKIMKNFGSRIREFISFDGQGPTGVNRAVGSRRYRITVRTQGGHSYGDFGRKNAIACLSALICDLYAVELPSGGKTTFNVGAVSGGTSVNTIAQQAEMLYEFRSDKRESMAYMEQQFYSILDRHRADDAAIEFEVVGDRPCSGDIDPDAHQKLMNRASAAAARHFGSEITFRPGSTDCNIPLSLGIPAVTVGCYTGGGAHTREEYMNLDSLLPGLKMAFELILHHF